MRISATDWVDGGWNLVDSIELCTQLKALGVDLIDVSTGGNVHNAPIKATPGFQVPFAGIAPECVTKFIAAQILGALIGLGLTKVLTNEK